MNPYHELGGETFSDAVAVVDMAADDFGIDWEPNPAALRIVKGYLLDRPEQGEWEYEDHWEGVAGGIIHALTQAGFRLIDARGPCIDPDCAGHFDYRGDTEQGPMYVCDGCKQIIYWNGSTGISGGTDA